MIKKYFLYSNSRTKSPLSGLSFKQTVTLSIKPPTRQIEFVMLNCSPITTHTHKISRAPRDRTSTWTPRDIFSPSLHPVANIYTAVSPQQHISLPSLSISLVSDTTNNRDLTVIRTASSGRYIGNTKCLQKGVTAIDSFLVIFLQPFIAH